MHQPWFWFLGRLVDHKPGPFTKTYTLTGLLNEFRTLVENSPDCIVRYDRDCRRTYVNPAFEKLTGKPAAMLLGKTPSEVSASNAKIGLQAHQAIKRVLAEGIPMEIELSWEEKTKRIRCHQVSLVPEFDHDGAVVSVLSNARDISKIRTYQKQLHDLAFFDPLPGLSNRAMFNERLLLSLTEAARHEQCLGLMFLDLDHFKVVNDLFGKPMPREQFEAAFKKALPAKHCASMKI